MKAIAILKNGIKLMEEAKLTNPMSATELDAEITLYTEAIEELEAPKHCMPDCRHYMTPTFDIDCPCRNCSRYVANKSIIDHYNIGGC